MYGVFKNFSREKCMHTANVRVGTGSVTLLLDHNDNISAKGATDYSVTPSGF